MQGEKKFFGFLQVFLLVVSVFSFGFLVGASSVSRQLEDGSLVDVVEQRDGSWVDSRGNIYIENEEGKLELFRGEGSFYAPSVSSTQNPAGFPTGVAYSRDTSGLGGGTTGIASPGADSSMGGEGVQAMAASMGQLGGLIQGPLGEALIWGGVLFGASMAVSSVLGAKQEMVEAISIAASVGAFSAKIAQGYLGVGTFPSLLIGAGVGFAVFMLIYEETKYEVVSFDCMPWQAPLGVSRNECEKCNDPTMPCSEYRCKSLGQMCEYEEEGDLCVYVDVRDVIPPTIKPNPDELTFGYEYSNVVLSPPGPGFDIIRSESSNACVRPFTPLRFGIVLDEPGQCKIDFESTGSFDEMRSFMGKSSLFKYEHYEQLVLPHPDYFGNTTFELKHGDEMTFYIRCRDKIGNYNEAEYAVNFCVDSSPDTTPPRIQATSMDDSGCIPANTDSALVDFYVNKPSLCRWSRVDQTFDLMDNNMVCSKNVFEMNSLQLYTCQANLTGITRDMTYFYIRCQDYQDKPLNERNTNQESLRFSVRGSNMLKLVDIGPNGTIFGGVSPLPVKLSAETLFGCDNGKANCFFSDKIDGDYILFADTGNDDGVHFQELFLTGGKHEYFIKCVDSGGNMIVDSVNFELDIDVSAPVISRVYNDRGQLKIVTLRDSECSYSNENCDFLFEEGKVMPLDFSKVHFADWDSTKTYYIKCRDEYRDLTADCSAIVRPMRFHE